MGAKPDLEIMGFIAREMGAAATLGPWLRRGVRRDPQAPARCRPLRRSRQRPRPRGPSWSGPHATTCSPRAPWGAIRKMLNSVLETGAAPMNFFVLSLLKSAVVAAVLLTTLAYLQWVERKVIAHIQVRPGPYRVGPHGLLQPLADVIKLLTKEDLIPPHVNKLLYLLAPFLAITMALLSIAVIPFGPRGRTSSASRPGCSSPTSTSACCSCWRFPPWGSTASRWRAGRRTTSTRCWAGCAARRR